jgi:hypothetical protein
LKKLVKPLFAGFAGLQRREDARWHDEIRRALDGTSVKVRVDYAGRDVQMISLGFDSRSRTQGSADRFGLRAFFGMGGGWDYITGRERRGVRRLVAGVAVSSGGAAERSRAAGLGPADV